MTKRNIILALASVLIMLGLFLTDPNGGAITVQFFQQFTLPIVAVWFAYICRKVLFDYVDMKELMIKAKESAIGAGLIFLGTCVVFFGLLGLFGNNAKAQDVTTYVPKRAVLYLPILKQEQKVLWADHPKPLSLPV